MRRLKMGIQLGTVQNGSQFFSLANDEKGGEERIRTVAKFNCTFLRTYRLPLTGMLDKE
jgi:hypothetical protein